MFFFASIVQKKEAKLLNIASNFSTDQVETYSVGLHFLNGLSAFLYRLSQTLIYNQHKANMVS